MTAWLALKDGWRRPLVVSPIAQQQTGASLGLHAGQHLTVGAVVPAMMMVSGNDAAYAVAQAVSGSEQKFVTLMNRTATQWGALGAHFANPTGLSSPKQWVTALAMANIAQHTMQSSALRRIVSLPYAILPAPDPKIFFNQNQLLSEYPGSIGIKMGYTVQGGATLAGAATRHREVLIVVLLHDNPATVWTDAQALLSWGFLRENHCPPQDGYRLLHVAHARVQKLQ